MGFNFGKLYKCPVCGKEFWVTDSKQWVYKEKKLLSDYFAHIPVTELGKKSRKHNRKRNEKGRVVDIWK